MTDLPKRERIRHKRSPWFWPLIALVVLLAAVVGGTLWALWL